MELKPTLKSYLNRFRQVLIVLYGIETRLCSKFFGYYRVLIVLYGIETYKLHKDIKNYFHVLIVLYGIETPILVRKNNSF